MTAKAERSIGDGWVAELEDSVLRLEELAIARGGGRTGAAPEKDEVRPASPGRSGSDEPEERRFVDRRTVDRGTGGRRLSDRLAFAFPEGDDDTPMDVFAIARSSIEAARDAAKAARAAEQSSRIAKQEAALHAERALAAERRATMALVLSIATIGATIGLAFAIVAVGVMAR
jgi:hypothetical protein